MVADPTAKRYVTAIAVSTALFVALTTAVLLWGAADRLDVRFVTWLDRASPESAVAAMRIVTYAGSGLVLGIVTAVAAIVLKRRGHPEPARFVIAAAVGALVVTQSLKAAIRRARPELDDPYVELSTYAFPSGHALGATATYGALAVVLYALVPGRGRRLLLVVTLASAILLVSASRVVLGVHYLLDVLAGIAGGIAIVSTLCFAFEVAPRRRLRRHEQPQRARLDT
jgi:membrane-associated phospholipid phosphatase